MDRDTDERLKSMTMRIHQTEELLTNQKNRQTFTGDPGSEPPLDVSNQVKVQMIDHRLNSVQQKVDALNPVFLLTMETRLEDLQSDLIELRNLYSSPTSSLNLVLDGLLKKVKDMEAGGGDKFSRDRTPRKMPASQMQGANSGTRNGNEGVSYRQGSSALTNAGLMQLQAHRGSLN